MKQILLMIEEWWMVNLASLILLLTWHLGTFVGMG
jgi:hypothetical protein